MNTICHNHQITPLGSFLCKFLCVLGCSVSLVAWTLGDAYAARLKATACGSASPGKFFDLVLNLDTPPEDETVWVKIKTVKSPAQNFMVQPSEIQLDRAGMAQARVKVSGSSGLYGVWTFEAWAFVEGKRVSDRFEVKFPLSLEQKKIGEKVNAPVGSVFNIVAHKLRAERDKYSQCEKLLRRVGAEPQEIYANWSDGKKDYERYVKNNFPKELEKVKTTGW